MAGDDDSRMTLLEISRRHKKHIVPLLLDIQEYKKPQAKDMGFLRSLECFRVGRRGGKLLQRTWVNACDDTDYVALSYTWNPSNYEPKKSEGYLIKNRKRTMKFRSPVRNCVFRRITKYMRAMRVDRLWIDRHSIPQRGKESYKKQKALQCMDFVYKLSEHPVALLGRPLMSDRELTLLYKVLTGRLVIRNYMTKGQRRDVIETLKLLHEITSDLWWQRAWTFQENYKGGARMTLLIRHPPSCERDKRKYRIFGSITGELCINSADFSKEVTRVCLNVPSTIRLVENVEEKIESILSAAGRYTELLDESQTMSPTIIADVEKRGVAKVWDRLPIVANCCSYRVRMDIENLRNNGHSLSLSMLTMCLLNGEILNNGLSNTHVSLNTTTSMFLKTHSFDEIFSPGEEKSLTFNKGCRFINVRLTESGIITYGHLWRLNRIIHTDQFTGPLPRVRNPEGDLTQLQHQHLTRLCRQLMKYRNSKWLGQSIKNYLKGDAIGETDFNFGENYMRMMMIEVAEAVKEGKRLRLGRLDDSCKNMAIFVWEGDSTTGFIFTSTQPKKFSTENHIADDTDRHVSLEVDLEHQNLPHLYVKGWVPGICFFVGCEREKVVFPWPRALTNNMYR
ncbi:hypothetical protein RRF57_001408 [Xylaria bambusicola]|uniref:Heterokaryon incompatibility domain-containing protein n=1 Tax=Xylaria bambusicola TaxID=326684 RepID=A0AAN7UDS5_9PEZI